MPYYIYRVKPFAQLEKPPARPRHSQDDPPVALRGIDPSARSTNAVSKVTMALP